MYLRSRCVAPTDYFTMCRCAQEVANAARMSDTKARPQVYRPVTAVQGLDDASLRLSDSPATAAARGVGVSTTSATTPRIANIPALARWYECSGSGLKRSATVHSVQASCARVGSQLSSRHTTEKKKTSLLGGNDAECNAGATPTQRCRENLDTNLRTPPPPSQPMSLHIAAPQLTGSVAERACAARRVRPRRATWNVIPKSPVTTTLCTERGANLAVAI